MAGLAAGSTRSRMDPVRTSTPELGTAIYLIVRWFGRFPTRGFATLPI